MWHHRMKILLIKLLFKNTNILLISTVKEKIQITGHLKIRVSVCWRMPTAF